MNPIGMGSPRGPAGRSSGNNRAGSNFSGDIIPKGYKAGQLQQFTPEQIQQLSGLFQHVGPESFLARLAGGDEESLRQSEAPAWRDFQEAQGQLGSRFSGMGMGARRGSGFQNAANQQSQDFAMQLQSRRQDLQRQSTRDLFELSNLLLGQKPYERTLTKKEHKPKWWESLLGTISPIAGDLYEGGSKNTGNFLSAKSILKSLSRTSVIFMRIENNVRSL